MIDLAYLGEAYTDNIWVHSDELYRSVQGWR
jgi:hypothetical protein